MATEIESYVSLVVRREVNTSQALLSTDERKRAVFVAPPELSTLDSAKVCRPVLAETHTHVPQRALGVVERGVEHSPAPRWANGQL